MKKIGLIIVIIGFCISFFALVISGFDIKKVGNIDSYIYKTSEDFSFEDLEINSDSNLSVEIELSDDDELKIQYSDSNKVSVDFELDGDKLIINYDYSIGFKISLYSVNPTLKIELPESFIGDIEITSKNGAIDIEDININNLVVNCSNSAISVSDVVAKQVYVSTSNSAINVNDIVCPDISLKTNNGVIRVDIIGDKSDYTIDVEHNNGYCNINDQESNVGKYLYVSTTNGLINVDFN